MKNKRYHETDKVLLENNFGSICNTEGKFTMTYKGNDSVLNYLLYDKSKCASERFNPRHTALVLRVLNFERNKTLFDYISRTDGRTKSHYEG